ncbi:DUF262 domain-containing protein [Clostridium haemolyticum]|uniref:DUF262 domain-containing protein n=1 Tax=Clostridium haemolyticum TaxID=84025 RepID=UPI001FA81F86|nr:DUF262 domain-containing protein [Clostridium haemolyticum]
MPSIKLKEIFSKNDENKLVLPDFQRDFVWDKEQQKKFIGIIFNLLTSWKYIALRWKKR